MSEKSFDYWDFFVSETRRNPAPLYEQFALGVSFDEELKAFANTVRAGQPPANILFAAVHFLLLCGADHPLRAFYPNLNGGRRSETLDGAFPAFKAFVEAHRRQLAPIVATRVTNTNEVGRSAVLHAGFRAFAQEAGEPLHLIELGPSAGLNLIWDSYGVCYRRDGETLFAGGTDPKLLLETALRGELSPLAGDSPRVASRVGLERDPVDLSSKEERDWLRALVWPDQVQRFARLDAALAVIAREPPPIRHGDALALLPEALAAIPSHEPVCVYHSFVLYQFAEEKRAALDNLLIAVSLRRPVWRLSWEGRLTDEAPLLLHTYREGVHTTRLLADAQPHGAWIAWKS